MKIRTGWLSRMAWGLSLAVILLSAMTTVAQSSEDQTIPAIFGGIVLVIILVFVLAGYIYLALTLHTIAEKTGTPNSWLAWIPIIHIFLMLSIAKKPAWWFVLFLIPLVNLVMTVIVWMEIAKARNKPDWWGILMIVPLANMIVPGYLAWAD